MAVTYNEREFKNKLDFCTNSGKVPSTTGGAVDGYTLIESTRTKLKQLNDNPFTAIATGIDSSSKVYQAVIRYSPARKTRLETEKDKIKVILDNTINCVVTGWENIEQSNRYISLTLKTIPNKWVLQ